MPSPDGRGFRLAVLNPGGRDPEQQFEGAHELDQLHAPVNFHAYAACTGGIFFPDTARGGTSAMPGFFLFRGGFWESEFAVRRLQQSGRAVAVSLKETGLHQIAAHLSHPGRLRRLLQLVRTANGCIAPTPEAADLYRSIRGSDDGVTFVPTPYPLHEQRWNFSRAIDDRRGIFVGTREWEVPSRNHAETLLIARQISEGTGAPVTVFNAEGGKGERLLGEIGFRENTLRVLKSGMPYAEYLRIVAEHRIILQMDTSFVPG